MDVKELAGKYRDKYFKDSDLFTLLGIESVNHKPHRFAIGPRHVAHAADHHGGMLGMETLRAVPCGHPRCQLMYDEHTFETALFVQLKRDGTAKESEEFFTPMREDWKADKIDGLLFVDTNDKFRIT